MTPRSQQQCVAEEPDRRTFQGSDRQETVEETDVVFATGLRRQAADMACGKADAPLHSLVTDPARGVAEASGASVQRVMAQMVRLPSRVVGMSATISGSRLPW